MKLKKLEQELSSYGATVYLTRNTDKDLSLTKINRNNVVLMHDFANNQKTVDALENIIKDAKSKGYTFSKITDNTPMVTHGVNN